MSTRGSKRKGRATDGPRKSRRNDPVNETGADGTVDGENQGGEGGVGDGVDVGVGDGSVAGSSSGSSVSIGPKTMDVRVAIKIVPEFRGAETELNTFVRACRKAYKAIDPDAREFFTEMVRGQCQGHAGIYLNSRPDHDNLETLLDDLKKAFGPKQSFNELLGSLTVVCQKRGESVRDYGMRVSSLVERTIGVTRRIHSEAKAEGVIEVLHNIARDSFVTGLRDDRVQDRVERRRPKRLLEAIDHGMEAEKIVSNREALRESSEIRDGSKSQGKIPRVHDRAESSAHIAHVENSREDRKSVKQEKPRKRHSRPGKCYKCRERGHTQDACQAP